MASLDFMKRDNDFMEEDDMFFSKRHSKAADDTSKDIQYFAGPVEFIIFMNESVKCIIHSLSYHFSSGD